MVASIESSIEDIKKGKMVILLDDEDRGNEGDLMIAAEKVTPEAINFMAKYGRGLICLSLTPDRVDELKLPMMVSENRARFQTAFTVSIEAKRGIWSARVIFFPSGRGRAECSFGPGRPRDPWTWHGWRD
jgi:3,4-dihydroxy 2-butanone 4-phosphate synthase/GTP cyclohydrolase II